METKSPRRPRQQRGKTLETLRGANRSRATEAADNNGVPGRAPQVTRKH